MSAEGPQAAAPSFMERPLVMATRLAVAYPFATVALAIGLAIASMVLTYAKLGYRTSRLDLLNPKSDYNRLWVEYINEFGEDDDAVVVVEGESREQVVPVLQEISSVLAHDERLFHAVLHGVDLSKIRSKGLHYLSADELSGVDRYLNDLGPIIDGNWSRLNLGNMAGGMAARMEMAAHGGTPEQQAMANVDIVTARIGPSPSSGKRVSLEPM